MRERLFPAAITTAGRPLPFFISSMLRSSVTTPSQVLTRSGMSSRSERHPVWVDVFLAFLNSISVSGSFLLRAYPLTVSSPAAALRFFQKRL